MVSAPRKPDIATDRFNLICFCLPSRFRIVIILFVQVVLFLCLFHLLSPIRKSASHADDVDDALSKAQQNRKVSGQGYTHYTHLLWVRPCKNVLPVLRRGFGISRTISSPLGHKCTVHNFYYKQFYYTFYIFAIYNSQLQISNISPHSRNRLRFHVGAGNCDALSAIVKNDKCTDNRLRGR